MENFFYDDKFISDFDSLLDELEIDEVSINDLDDDWQITCQASTLEKMFVFKKEFIKQHIINATEIWEQRFPEESDELFARIENAINDSIDIEKLNEGIPELYYPNGNYFQITKQDLIEYLK